MNAEQEWVLFLERNPQFYEISKGRFFVKFLESVCMGAKSFSDLSGLFPKIEEKDLQQITDVLLKLKVISKSKADNNVFFGLTPEGKRFLVAYHKAKKFFCT